MDELLLLDEEMLDAAPEDLPRRLLTNFAVYNAEVGCNNFLMIYGETWSIVAECAHLWKAVHVHAVLEERKIEVLQTQLLTCLTLMHFSEENRFCHGSTHSEKELSQIEPGCSGACRDCMHPWSCCLCGAA